MARGAWWTGADASWHPTWKSWGCIPPHPPWWQGNRWTPDELVLKQNVADRRRTAPPRWRSTPRPPRQIHGDMDAKYTIEARVVDASRREERGTGSVIAARRPFEVVVWTNRGYAKAGDAMEAHDLRRHPRRQTGRRRQRHAQDLSAESWAPTAASTKRKSNRGRWRPTPRARPGRNSPRPPPASTGWPPASRYKGGEAVEGATILNVHGPGRDDPAAWKFGPLELVADKSEYTPGETAQAPRQQRPRKRPCLAVPAHRRQRAAARRNASNSMARASKSRSRSI